MRCIWFGSGAIDRIGLGTRSLSCCSCRLNTSVGGLSYKAGRYWVASFSREVRLRRAELVLEAFRRVRDRQEICEAVTPFYVFRTDTKAVLARGVMGYDAAKDTANQLRKKYGLKWDQVSFKSERSLSNKFSKGQGGRPVADTNPDKYAKGWSDAGRHGRGNYSGPSRVKYWTKHWDESVG